MTRLRAMLSVLGVAIGAACVAYWTPACDDSIDDKKPLPPLPIVPEGAIPRLLSAAPLPEAEHSLIAKPVIAADREHRVVVAQDGLSGLSLLIGWRAGDDNRWSAWQTLEKWPAEAHFVGDPWIQTDRRGRFFLVHTCLDGGILAIRRSTDFAATWSAAREIAKLADRPVVGISPSGKHLVIAASMVEVRNNTPNKAINLPLHDPQREETLAASTRNFAGVFVSPDHGRNWKRISGPLAETHAVPFSVICDDEGRIAGGWIAAKGYARFNVPAASRSVVCSTTDHGETWTETELVANLQPDRMHPFTGERFPVLALDSAGIVHCAYVEALAKALFVTQSDNWSRWKKALLLSSQTAEEIRMPAIAALGPMVHVTWMERRDGHWQMWYRGSRNHGETWSEALMVSPPHASATLIDEVGFDQPLDDDQSCIADDGAGTVFVVWTVLRSGRAGAGRIWLATVKWQ